MPALNSINDLTKEMSQWRYDLHQNAQTAYEETFANGLIKQKLTEWGIEFKDGLAKTGIVATIKGQKSSSGKSIGLRADMDALDITEETGLPHASKNRGKMHACGHDGHTATLLGVAKHLSETKNFDGTVHLIFQPAEEGEKGAHSMIEDGFFKHFPCDYIFAYHNWPYLEYGKMATRAGPLLASVDTFEISIDGKGGHAAMPHKTIDPIVTGAQIVTALQTIVSRNIDPINTAVVSVTNFNAGTGALNIIPEIASINGTIRTFDNETRDYIKQRIKEISKNIAAACGAKLTFTHNAGTDPTVNHADAVTMAVDAAGKIVGPENVSDDYPPTMGGEDFGAFLSHCPGAFLIVGQQVTGADNSPHNHGLHTPYYDFNNDILPLAASYFVKLAEDYMPLKAGSNL